MEDSWLLSTSMFLNANCGNERSKCSEKIIYSNWWNDKCLGMLWEKGQQKEDSSNQINKLEACFVNGIVFL